MRCHPFIHWLKVRTKKIVYIGSKKGVTENAEAKILGWHYNVEV